MSDKKKIQPSLVTPECRASFVNLDEPNPKAKTKDGKGKYTLTLLFKKGEDLTKFQQACMAVLTDKFGADKDKWPKKVGSPFLDQGDYEYEGYEKGAKMLRVSTTVKPAVVGPKKDPKSGKFPPVEAGTIYPGCWIRASIRPGWYDVDGNRGVSFFLDNVQFLREGPSISGSRRKPEQDFDEVEGGDVFGADAPANDGETSPEKLFG